MSWDIAIKAAAIILPILSIVYAYGSRQALIKNHYATLKSDLKHMKSDCELRIGNNTQRLERMQDGNAEQWSSINRQTEKLADIRERLGKIEGVLFQQRSNK